MARIPARRRRLNTTRRRDYDTLACLDKSNQWLFHVARTRRRIASQPNNNGERCPVGEEDTELYIAIMLGSTMIHLLSIIRSSSEKAYSGVGSCDAR
jgi:hypothetical protein